MYIKVKSNIMVFWVSACSDSLSIKTGLSRIIFNHSEEENHFLTYRRTTFPLGLSGSIQTVSIKVESSM